MWLLRLREEYKTKVFENGVLRRMSEPSKEERTHMLEKRA
jgi:hypothetical protein